MPQTWQNRAMTIFRLMPFAIPLVFATPAPAAVGAARIPVPMGNPADWVSSSDYPRAALRDNLEGISRFTLTIDPNGIVENCQISVSSGSSELDAVTCRLITDRARFEPARNSRGKPTSGRWSSSVRWQIPKLEQEQLQSGMVIRSYLVLVDGTMSDCRTEVSGGESIENAPIGPFPCPNKKFSKPFTDANGQPLIKRVRVTMKMEVVDE